MTAVDVAALAAHLDDWGITRLADTTHLDRTGIPTASAVKPATADGIWVYSGKGTTQDQARTGAVFECLERTLSQWPAQPTHLRWAPAVASPGHWEPARFTAARRPDEFGAAPIPWVVARRFDSDNPVVVPAHAVFNGRPPAWAGRSPFEALTSNGLAAHSTASGALEAALCEVVERHTVSWTEVFAAHGPYLRLAGLATRLGIDLDVLRDFREDHTLAQTIDPTTIPGSARWALASLQRAGLDVTIKRLSSDIDLPTYGAAAVERTGMAEFLACAGYGTRLDHEAALLAALLELAQTRATDLQGAREDRYLPEKSRISRLPANHWLLDAHTPTPFLHQPALPPDARVAAITDALSKAGFPEWAVHWFPSPAGVYACRVLVPGLETWHVTAGASRFGASLTRRLGG